MDKTQAAHHISTRLRAGYNPAEITEELSRILKAPVEATGRFVDQVLASHPEAVPAPPTPHDDVPVPGRGAPVPEWMEALPIQGDQDIEQMTPASSVSQFTNSDLPPGLQALINEAGSSPGRVGAAPSPEPAPISGEPLPRQAEFVPPVTESKNLDDDLSPKINLESLSKEVLKRLKKTKTLQ